MSLYIGKLPPRIRRVDLEHVFKRFGQCNVKMKDGYGFVVYDSLPDAQKALRALQGRNICGERLPVTWSNIQPKDGKKFATGARHYESERGRNYGKGTNNSNGKSDGRRRGLHLRLRETDAEKFNPANMIDEWKSYHQNDSNNPLREQHLDNGENLGKSDGFLVENQQYEHVNEISNTHRVDNGIECERHAPSRVTNGKGDGEYHSGRSGSSQLKDGGNMGMEKIKEADRSHVTAPKSKLTCYGCGELGHKKRDCPEGSTLRQKPSRVDRSDDDINRRDRGKRKLDEYGSEAQEKQLSIRDFRSRRMRSTGKISERAKSSSIIIESSPKLKEIHESQKWEYEGMKRRERNEDLRRQDSKRARMSTSSHRHSTNSSSRIQHSASHSCKSIPLSKRHSRSRSVSNRADSFSSNSRATSVSNHSKYRVTKSESRASTPLSLSLSPSMQNTSSPSKRQFNSKGSMGNSTPLEPKDILIEQEQTAEGIKYSLVEHVQTAEAINEIEDTDLCNLDASPDNGNKVSPFRDGGYLELEDQPLLTDDAKLKNAVSSFTVEDERRNDLNLEKNGEDNVITAAQSHYGAETSTLLSEKSNLSDGNLSMEGLRETMGQQNSSSLIEYMPVSAEMQNINTQAPDSSCSSRSTCISSEEMCMVLEHYGLDLPNEDEKNLPIDVYFGSARLWPWELIYYRRLKKGPISVENYARRVAQNREHGIVDSFIRSSSGWGELSEENI